MPTPLLSPPPQYFARLPQYPPEVPNCGIPAAARRTDDEVEADVVIKWFSRIGALAILVGIGFAFKYAIDKGILGPAGRIAIGVLLGAGFVAWGEWAYRKYWTVLAQSLVAVGISILFLAVLVGSQLYGLYPPGVSFVLVLLLTIASASLAIYHDSSALAVLTVVGGFTNPFVIAESPGGLPILLVYVALLDMGVLLLSYLRNWRHLPAFALAGTWVFVWFSMSSATGGQVLGFATAYLLVFVAISVGKRWIQESRDPSEPVVVAVSTGAYAVTAIFALTGFPPGSRPMLLATVGLALVILAGITKIRGHDKVMTLTLLGCATGLSFMSLAVAAPEFFDVDVGRPLTSPVSLSVLIEVAFLYGAASILDRDSDEDELAMSSVTGVSAGVITVVWLGLVTASSFRLVADPALRAIAGLVITVIWLVYAAGSLAAGTRLRLSWLRVFALVVASVACVKLVLVDALRILPVLSSSRVLLSLPSACLAVCVAAISAIAYLLHADSEDPWAPSWAVAAGVAANLTAIIWFSLEAAAAFDSAGGLRSRVQDFQLSLSAIWVAYAASLLAAGVALRGRWIRILGIAIFGVTIVKMALVDVWTLTTPYRVIVFMGMGLILLLSALAYQRFKVFLFGPSAP